MMSAPTYPRLFGLAGLLPQLLCLFALWFGPADWKWTALAISYGYAALIFSFLGGMWWGLASAADARGQSLSPWVWVAAVAPSLLALMTYIPWVLGWSWPTPSLIALGVMLPLSLLVDWRLASISPSWWMRLRITLSCSLGAVTLLIALPS